MFSPEYTPRQEVKASDMVVHSIYRERGRPAGAERKKNVKKNTHSRSKIVVLVLSNKISCTQNVLHLVRYQHFLELFRDGRLAVRDVHVSQDEHQLAEISRHFGRLRTCCHPAPITKNRKKKWREKKCENKSGPLPCRRPLLGNVLLIVLVQQCSCCCQ